MIFDSIDENSLRVKQENIDLFFSPLSCEKQLTM
jgi:hypothetical protein